MENTENNWNAAQDGGAATGGGDFQQGNGTSQGMDGRQNDNGWSGGYQEAGYQNAGYQNNGFQGNGYQNNGYQNGPYQNAYSQNGSPYQGAPLKPDGYMEGPEEPISVGEWLITMLVLAIPCVNLVMLFVWGFGSTEKRTKANYCKAALIWSGIMIALSVILYVVVLAGMMSAF